MAEEDEVAEADAADSGAAQKKKKLMLLGGILAALLLVSGGGTWALLHFLGGGKAAEQHAEAEGGDHKGEEAAAGAAKEEAEYLEMEPNFLANFNVNGRQHYLQLSLAVLTRSDDAIAKVKEHMPLIRNRIVLLLSGESFETLQTDAGRVALQQQLLEAIREILQKETGKPEVEQVLFTNFVMT